MMCSMAKWRCGGVAGSADHRTANQRGMEVFCKLDNIQGYWQMSLHESAKDLSTMVIIDGMLTPTMVP